MDHSDLRLEVVMERTADLVPYARNAKRHTDEQVGQIANSIREFGFADPVGVWTNAEGESEIVEGHGRVLAAERLGIGEVPVIHLDALTDEQRRAYALAHNQLTMSTGWDFDALNLELDMLAEGFDMGDFGFLGCEHDREASKLQEQSIPENAEVDLTKFSDGSFMHACPRCGFRFNE